jgi:hypothetical protein
LLGDIWYSYVNVCFPTEDLSETGAKQAERSRHKEFSRFKDQNEARNG